MAGVGFLRRILARRRLQRMVDRAKNSFACQQYRSRREAALKGWRTRRAG